MSKRKNLESKTRQELISIIESMEAELRQAKKEAQTIRREINRMRKTLKNIKVRYDELVDIVDVDSQQIDHEKVKDLQERPTTCQCPKCKSEDIRTLDLNILFKKQCLQCGFILEKERKV